MVQRLPGHFNVESMRPDSRRDFVIPVEAPEGRAEIPLVIIRGTRSRPRVALIAGVHGDEVTGIDGVLTTLEAIEDQNLGGTLFAVPVANPPAFAASSRLSPVDGLNLNRVFPGDPTGSLTERIAHALIQQVISGVDLVMSMHGASASGDLFPWVEFQHVESEVGLASYRAALVTAFDYLYPIRYGLEPGLLLSACQEIGVPAIEGERGGVGIVDPMDSIAYVVSALRLFGHLGVRPVLSSMPGARPKVIEPLIVAAGHGGFWVPRVSPGKRVRTGEYLGQTRDLYGNLVEEVTAPAPGPVMMVRTWPSVTAGDRLLTIGRPVRLSRFFRQATKGLSATLPGSGIGRDGSIRPGAAERMVPR